MHIHKNEKIRLILPWSILTYKVPDDFTLHITLHKTRNAKLRKRDSIVTISNFITDSYSQEDSLHDANGEIGYPYGWTGITSICEKVGPDEGSRTHDTKSY